MDDQTGKTLLAASRLSGAPASSIVLLLNPSVNQWKSAYLVGGLK